MTNDVLPPPSTQFGTWVRKCLREEPIAWLTTVDMRGVPQPNPVWFVWDGESILIYNLPNARRLGHLRRRVKVSLHLDTHGQDGDAIILSGSAEISPERATRRSPHGVPREVPPAHEHGAVRMGPAVPGGDPVPPQSVPGLPRGGARPRGARLSGPPACCARRIELRPLRRRAP